jgi:hypothetical protein
MTVVMLNGRPATDAEVAALDDAARCARERELQLLAGVTTSVSVERVPRPVTDIIWALP